MKWHKGFAALALASVFTQPILAAPVDAKAEQKVLQEFIEIYNESKTIRDLAQKIGFHQGISTDRMLDLMGGLYLQPLPKLSYDLGLKRMTFTFKDETGVKTTEVKFQNIAKGEALMNGKSIKINPRISGIENVLVILEQGQKKERSGAWLENFGRGSRWQFAEKMIAEARAQSSHPELITKKYSQGNYPGNASALRDWTLMGILDKAAIPVGILSGVTAASVPIVGAGMLQGGVSATTVLAVGTVAGTALSVFPLHYGMKKLEAWAAPSCEDQAKEIAEHLRSAKMMLGHFQCNWAVSDPEIVFVTPHEKQTLHANWERQDAYFDSGWSTDSLYIFDRERLTAVREIHEFKDSLRKNGSVSGHVATIAHFEKGPEFDKARQAIEPYRKVLEVMGRSESCYKCEDKFQKLLVRRVGDRGPYKVDTYPELSKSSEGPSNSQSFRTEH